MSVFWILETWKLCKLKDGNNNIKTIRRDASGCTPRGWGNHPASTQSQGWRSERKLKRRVAEEVFLETVIPTRIDHFFVFHSYHLLSNHWYYFAVLFFSFCFVKFSLRLFHMSLTYFFPSSILFLAASEGVLNFVVDLFLLSVSFQSFACSFVMSLSNYLFLDLLFTKSLSSH